MDTTKNPVSSGTTLSNSSSASTSEVIYYCSRWVSANLNQTSVSANTWTFGFGAQQSNSNANFPVSGTNQPIYVNCYVWKPSNGTKYGTILDGNTASTVDEPSGGASSDEVAHIVDFTGSAVSSLTTNDACIVFEVWFRITQGMATSYTQTFIYDGNSETFTENGSVGISQNLAAYIETPENLTFSGANNVERSLSETVTISEVSLTRLAAKNRTGGTQTVTSGESIARLAAKMRSLATETVDSTEDLQKVKGKDRPLPTETVTISESSLTRLAEKIRTASDTTTIGESSTRLAEKMRALGTETVTSTDDATFQKGKLKELIETVTVGDSLDRLVQKTRAITENTTIGESINRLAEKIRALATQTVTIGDSVDRVKGANRTASDTITINDTLNRLADKIRILVDTTTTNDSLDRLADKIRTLSDSITIGDNVVIEVGTGGAVERTLTETVTINEQLDRLAEKIRTLATQTVDSTEQTTRTKGSMKSLSDSITIGAGTVGNMSGKIRTIIETVISSENLTRLTDKARSISETITTSDIATALKQGPISAHLTLTEIVSISDFVARAVSHIGIRPLGAGAGGRLIKRFRLKRRSFKLFP